MYEFISARRMKKKSRDDKDRKTETLRAICCPWRKLISTREKNTLERDDRVNLFLLSTLYNCRTFLL